MPSAIIWAVKLCGCLGIRLRRHPLPVVVAYWIDEENYSAFSLIFADATDAPTWPEWLKMAEKMEQGLQCLLHVVMRSAHQAGCRLWIGGPGHGTSPGGSGRKKFVRGPPSPRDTAPTKADRCCWALRITTEGPLAILVR